MILTKWCFYIQFIDRFDTGADMSIKAPIIVASIAGLVCLAIVCTGLALQLLYCWMELDALAIQKTACKSNRTSYHRYYIHYSFTPYFSIYILHLFFSFLRFQ